MAIQLSLYSSNGNLNLTQYVAAEKGEGLEPGAPSFTSKVMARSILKPGATLALEELKEKEQVFPLKLQGKNKDAVIQLVQEINTIINTPGATAEWQDAGSSEPTFWDIISGQFDDEYDKFLGDQNWIKGKLRLFVQPLGYLSRKGARALKVSGIATTIAVGTTPIVVFKSSEALRGDASALVQTQITTTGATNACFAVSVLPSLEYIPLLPAASNAISPTSFLHEAGTPQPTVAHYIAPGVTEKFKWSVSTEAKYAYVGEQRVFAVARVPAGYFSPALRTSFQGIAGEYTTPVATTTWKLYDLGTVTTASSSLNSAEPYAIALEFGTAGASYACDIACAIQLPSNKTSFLNSALSLAANVNPNQVGFDGVSNAIRLSANMGVPASGIAPSKASSGSVIFDASAYVRGPIPPALASIEDVAVAALALNNLGGSTSAKIEVNVNVVERTRYLF